MDQKLNYYVNFAHRDVTVSTAYMPILTQRIHDFCAAFDTDTSGPELVEFIWKLYATRDLRLGLWYITSETGLVVGHLLAEPEPFEGQCKYVLVRQAQADKGHDTRRETKAVWGFVERWARDLGAKQITIVTHKDESAMARRWGFTYYKHIMRKAL